MSIDIVSFKKEYSKSFYDLNIEWLEKFFYVEPYDREILSSPEKYIITPGGHVFFALEKEKVVGTVALLHHHDHVYELTKMAVPPKQQGKKIGQHLLNYCIDFGRRNNFSDLILYSHTKLENAIYIYKKYGFEEIELNTDNPYKRSDIKMRLKYY